MRAWGSKSWVVSLFSFTFTLTLPLLPSPHIPCALAPTWRMAYYVPYHRHITLSLSHLSNCLSPPASLLTAHRKYFQTEIPSQAPMGFPDAMYGRVGSATKCPTISALILGGMTLQAEGQTATAGSITHSSFHHHLHRITILIQCWTWA